jgi:probable selenium-dependent hydroxylase accessory protein YqeC
LNLAPLLLPLLPPSGGVIALVGAGGKTSALFGLAGELAEGSPSGVLMTTTTHLFDPRLEPDRAFDQLVLAPDLAEPAGPAWEGPAGPGRRIVLAAREEPGLHKLQGIHPARIAELARTWAFIIVEADGAKRLPVKAPAAHEPVVPPEAGVVLGFVGLDCLGRPMDETTVHRPERFGPVTGCAPGAPIRLEHIASLTCSPRGLFQGAPAGARRVLVLNKADQCATDPEVLLRELRAAGPVAADLILVCTLQDPRPWARVLAQAQSQ